MKKLLSTFTHSEGRFTILLLSAIFMFTLACGGGGGGSEGPTAPDAPVISGIANGSFNSDQTFTISGAADAAIEYTLDGGINWLAYSSAVILTSEGVYTIAARQVLSGKTSASTLTYVVTIDKTLPDPPLIDGISDGSFNTDQTFTITASENSIVYSIDGGSTWIAYTSAVTLSGEDTYIIMAKQSDAAENGSATTTPIEVTIDKTVAAPVINDIVNGSYNTNKTFTVSGESGAAIQYRVHSGDSWTAYSGQVTLSSEDNYQITARQTDVAGNVSVNAEVLNVTIDKTGPGAPGISGITTGSFNTNQVFTVIGTETVIQYSIDGGYTWLGYNTSVTLSADGVYTVVAKQFDAAGNESGLSDSYVVTIDKTAPGIIIGCQVAVSNQQVTLSWTEPVDADFSKVQITFTPTASDVPQPIEIPKGTTIAQITPLTNATQYSFTIRSIDTSGNLSNGTVISATPGVPPAVTTDTIAANLIYSVNISGTSARGGGNVTSQGSSTVTSRGLCWNTTGSPTITGTFVANGSGTGAFSTASMTGLTVNTVYYVRAYATNSSGTSYGNEVSFNSGRTFGTVYAGGYVFYNNGNGGGLLAATSAAEFQFAWIEGGSTQTTLNGNTGTAVGTGLTNSNAIASQSGHLYSAASTCLEYDDGTYSDWFMPSKDELYLMYTKLKANGYGGFLDNWYLSSSEYNASNAWLQCFWNTTQGEDVKSYYYRWIRPIRAF